MSETEFKRRPFAEDQRMLSMMGKVEDGGKKETAKPERTNKVLLSSSSSIMRHAMKKAALQSTTSTAVPRALCGVKVLSMVTVTLEHTAPLP